MKYLFLMLFLCSIVYGEFNPMNPRADKWTTNTTYITIWTNRYSGVTKTNVHGFGDLFVSTNYTTNITYTARTVSKPYADTLSVFNGLVSTNANGYPALSILLWHQYSATNEFTEFTNALNVALLSTIHNSTNALDIANDLAYVKKTGSTITGILALSNTTFQLLTTLTPVYTTNGLVVTGSATYSATSINSVFVLESVNYGGSGYSSWTNTIGGTLLRCWNTASLSAYYIQAQPDTGNPDAGWKNYLQVPTGGYAKQGGAAYSTDGPTVAYSITASYVDTVITNTFSASSSGQMLLNGIELYDYTSMTNKLKLDGVY